MCFTDTHLLWEWNNSFCNHKHYIAEYLQRNRKHLKQETMRQTSK